MSYCWKQQIEDGRIEKDKHMTYLITGHGARRELKALYDKVSSLGYDTNWIDEKDEISFWTKMLDWIKVDPDQAKVAIDGIKQNGYESVEKPIRDALKNGNRHHLFIPDIAKVFYKFDIEQKGIFNKSLRTLSAEKDNNLNVYASADAIRSKEYNETLGTCRFSFNADNFLTDHLF